MTTEELIQWVISVLMPAASGLGGVALGGRLTARQERRKEKREAYADILRALSDSYVASQAVAVISESNQTGTALYLEHLEKAVAAQQRASQTMAVALVVLPAGAVAVLHTFEREWQDAPGGTTGEIAKARLAVVDRTTDALLKVARKDLN